MKRIYNVVVSISFLMIMGFTNIHSNDQNESLYVKDNHIVINGEEDLGPRF